MAPTAAVVADAAAENAAEAAEAAEVEVAVSEAVAADNLTLLGLFVALFAERLQQTG